MVSLPVESSWRMVDGEHDSFDTSIVPNGLNSSGEYNSNNNNNNTNEDGDDPFISSSGAPSQHSFSRAAAAARRDLGTRTISAGSSVGAAGLGGGAGASSSQEDRISLGGDSFAGSLGGGSVGGSQDDDIHSFLRKAENDERVLLRLPFQPSLPSSVRQSPLSVSSAGNNNTKTTGNGRLDRRTFQTPEPEFHMPTIDMDGSLHMDGGPPNALRQRGAAFRVSDTGSPAQRRRTGLKGGLNGAGGSKAAAAPSAAAPFSAAAWRQTLLSWRTFLLLLGLAAAYGAALFASGSGTVSARSSTQRIYSTTIGSVCGIPGIVQLGLPFCPSANNKPASSLPDGDGATDASQDENYWTIRNRFNDESRQAATEGGHPVNGGGNNVAAVSLVRSAGELMRAQTQLAGVVRERVLARRGGHHRSSGESSAPPAQDAWLVPRARTKDLRMAAQIQQGSSSSSFSSSAPGSGKKQQQHRATLLLLALDAYLDAARRVSIALSRLQTGAAATAADTLVHSSRRTLAQLRRMAAAVDRETHRHDGDNNASVSGGWLSRLLSSAGGASYNSAGRRRDLLLDAYRRHTDALLAKTRDRVGEAEAVLKALEGANGHLTDVQSFVTARRDELAGFKEGGGGSGANSNPASAGSAGPSDSSDPARAGGGLFSWLWGVFFGHGQGQDNSAPLRPASLNKMSKKTSKAARAWSGYADELQHLREAHDAAVGRAVEALDELAAVRDVLSELQLRFGGGDGGDGGDGTPRVASIADEGDLDMRLHMDIVEAGIQDLEAAGR